MNQNFENLSLDIHGVRLPQIIIPDEDYKRVGVPNTTSNYDFLVALCKKGFEEKVNSGELSAEDSKLHKERVKEELELIKELGFTDYILLVWDVINYCRKQGIPVGRGRGSAASSQVLYFIGVTGINALKYGLFFARFINKARAKSIVVDGVQYIDGDLAPDVDLDICHERREEVIQYLENKYQGKFCKLPTYNTLTTKQLIRECSKIVADFTEDQIKLITSQIPTLFGKVFSLEKSREESEKFAEFCKNNPEIIEIAAKLENLIKNRGAHASAYLISHHNLNEFIPCEKGANGEILCSPDMYFAQKESIKLDLLGLDCLTLIDRVCKKLQINPDRIDAEDYEKIYANLQDLRYPYGLFQISGDANVRVVRQVKPKGLKDLSAVVALARPGALAYVDDYVNNKDQSFGDTRLKEILSISNNVLIYQEQITQILNRLFGWSNEHGELVRRAIGKKKKDEMAKFESEIRETGKKNNLPDELVEWFWQTANASADYQFNLSHSVSYATLSALTVYLKFNYPEVFFLEALKLAQFKPNKMREIQAIQHELPYFGIQLLPPDFLKSDMDFTIEGKNIRYGLSSIKGISDKTIGNVQDFIDKETANKFEVFQAANEAKVNIGVLSAMIQAGALSSLSNNRPLAVLEAQLWNLLTDKEKAYCLSNGEKYQWNLIEMVKNISNWVDDNGKKVARSTRFDTIKKRYEPYKEIYLLNKKYPLFASWVYEKQLLGYSYSTTLKDVFKYETPNLEQINVINDNYFKDQSVEVVGEVVEITKGASKAGNKYMKILLGDETGITTCLMVGKKLEEYLQENKYPVENNIVYIKGKKGDDVVWIDRVAIQDYKIYMKLSELKK